MKLKKNPLLNPPVKISLPGLRVTRKCKAESPAAIKETQPPGGLPSAPRLRRPVGGGRSVVRPPPAAARNHTCPDS